VPGGALAKISYFVIMQDPAIKDDIFSSAVGAIDEGDIPALQQIVSTHPRLLAERLINSGEGYFKDPYLLYFVADNPIRTDRLPANIVAITKLLIDALKTNNIASLQEQLDYTLGLVSTGRIPHECGVQIALIDLLLDEGAAPGNALGALANGNIDAARHLVQRNAPLTLATATGLGSIDDIQRLAPTASPEEKLTALAVAAFYGKPNLIGLLLTIGADPNGYPDGGGFHSHGTPLHQAVASGSLASVKLLVEAGAGLTAKDKIFSGTPLGWAGYLQREEAAKDYTPIIDYLEGRQ
jgi:peptide-methionine (S)-S-oxide reductase